MPRHNDLLDGATSEWIVLEARWQKRLILTVVPLLCLAASPAAAQVRSLPPSVPPHVLPRLDPAAGRSAAAVSSVPVLPERLRPGKSPVQRVAPTGAPPGPPPYDKISVGFARGAKAIPGEVANIPVHLRPNAQTPRQLVKGGAKSPPPTPDNLRRGLQQLQEKRI
jgi:hypothetical protein